MGFNCRKAVHEAWRCSMRIEATSCTEFKRFSSRTCKGGCLGKRMSSEIAHAGGAEQPSKEHHLTVTLGLHIISNETWDTCKMKQLHFYQKLSLSLLLYYA